MNGSSHGFLCDKFRIEGKTVYAYALYRPITVVKNVIFYSNKCHMQFGEMMEWRWWEKVNERNYLNM